MNQISNEQLYQCKSILIARLSPTLQKPIGRVCTLAYNLVSASLLPLVTSFQKRS